MPRQGDACPSLCIDQQFRFFAATRRDIVNYRVARSVVQRHPVKGISF